MAVISYHPSHWIEISVHFLSMKTNPCRGCEWGEPTIATKGEKTLLTSDKTRKTLSTSNKKINLDLPTTETERSKILTDNRQVDPFHSDPP